MDGNLSHLPAEKRDFGQLCEFRQDAGELFFMFTQAEWPLTAEQLEAVAAARSGPTAVLADGVLAGYANFYGVLENRICTVSNLIVAPRFRNRVPGGSWYGREHIRDCPTAWPGGRTERLCAPTQKHPRGIRFYGFTPAGGVSGRGDFHSRGVSRQPLSLSYGAGYIISS